MHLFTDILPRESMSYSFSCWRGTSQCPVFRLWVQEKKNLASFSLKFCDIESHQISLRLGFLVIKIRQQDTLIGPL